MSTHNRKKQRIVEHLAPSQKIYIFCEGKQTEPLYFEAFKREITKNPIYKNSVFVSVNGLGKETLRVVKYAENYVYTHEISGAQIWCVYDKDSFPNEDFNMAETVIENLNNSQSSNVYYAAWSNQCVEYWFILHFSYYTSNNDRKYYRSFLHKKFAELGWDRYEKNNEELFSILITQGNPKQAIIWSEKQLKSFNKKTPSKSAPATKVHLLVQELAKYLPDELKQRFL